MSRAAELAMANDLTRPTESGDRSAPPAKKPYAKPRILLREPIESVAADCNITGGKSDRTFCTLGFS